MSFLQTLKNLLTYNKVLNFKVYEVWFGIRKFILDSSFYLNFYLPYAALKQTLVKHILFIFQKFKFLSKFITKLKCLKLFTSSNFKSKSLKLTFIFIFTQIYLKSIK